MSSKKLFQLYIVFREGERRKCGKEENGRERDKEKRMALWVKRRENFWKEEPHRRIWTCDGSAQQEQRPRVVTSPPNPQLHCGCGCHRPCLSFWLGATIAGSPWLWIWTRCYHPWLSFLLGAAAESPAVWLFLSKLYLDNVTPDWRLIIEGFVKEKSLTRVHPQKFSEAQWNEQNSFFFCFVFFFGGGRGFSQKSHSMHQTVVCIHPGLKV